MSGSAAHELNNLISIINGYSQILATQLTDRPTALRQAGEIHKAGEKAAALIRQLLDA